MAELPADVRIASLISRLIQYSPDDRRGRLEREAAAELARIANPAEKSLVHAVCQYLRDEAAIARNIDPVEQCSKCPLTVETNYGPGVQGCVLRAQQLLELVRSHFPTPAESR